MYGLYKSTPSATTLDYYVVLDEQLGIYVSPAEQPDYSLFGFKAVVWWGYQKIKEWEENT